MPTEIKTKKPVTDHIFSNPCHCGCDGQDMCCNHYNEDMVACEKSKDDHVFETEEELKDYHSRASICCVK